MLKVVFAGSPECAVPALEATAKSHAIVAVLTNPPAPAGRSATPIPTPVHAAALTLQERGIIQPGTPILTPEKITDEIRAAIAATEPDCMACFAYGKIFGPKTLALFPMGAFNVHPSLLPRWRGCAPVPAAILAQDAETGVTVQRMALEMDAGDIVAQRAFPLDGTETADGLLTKSSAIGAELLVEALRALESGTLSAKAQEGDKATYCSMLRKEDGRIDWSESASAISARIRAFHPWPGAFTSAPNHAAPSGFANLIVHRAHPLSARDATNPAEMPEPGTVLSIDKKEGILVQTGNGVLALEILQWQTKKTLDWKSFINGTRDFVGSTLGKEG